MAKVKTDGLKFNVVAIEPPPPPPSTLECLKCEGHLKYKNGRYICDTCGSIFVFKHNKLVLLR